MLARLKLIRPLNLFFIFLGQLAIIFKGSTNHQFLDLFFFVLATVMSAAGGYVINDVFDRKADKINRPKRPLISGQTSLINAVVFYLVLVATSVLSAYYSNVSGWLFIVMFINVILFLYSLFVKRMILIGNFLVAGCTGLVFGACNLLFEEPLLLATELGFIAFFATFLRENYKTIEDVEGDSIAGYRTFPIMLGVNHAMRTAGFLTFVFGGALIVHAIYPFYFGFISNYWSVIEGVSGLFITILGIFALRNQTVKYAAKLSTYLKVTMAVFIVYTLLLV